MYIRVELTEGLHVSGQNLKVGIGGAQPLQLRISKTITELEILPAGVGSHALKTHKADGFLHIRIRGSKQAGLDLIERAEAKIPAPGDIEGSQISTHPNQIVANGIDHLRINLLSRLQRHTTKDAGNAKLLIARHGGVTPRGQDTQRGIAGEGRRRSWTIRVKREGPRLIGGVEVKIHQRHAHWLPVSIKDREIVSNHGVAHAIGHCCKLVANAGVRSRLIIIEAVLARTTNPSTTQQNLGKLSKDDALILRLVDDFGCLEDLLRRNIKTSR